MLQSANNDVAIKNQQLEANLLKIQILIKEIHHRVKNNMQIISSLLNMQRNDQKNDSAAEALDESKRRIQSMALVHQQLYETEDLSHIKVKQYIEQLVDSVESTLTQNTIAPIKNIEVPSDLVFNIDTMIPLGLILNELITNSYKYAFLKDKENIISVSVAQKESVFQLIYSDNGSGIPDTIHFKNSGTLGLELVHILTEQLEGRIEYKKTELSSFIIEFKKVIK
jgi:two-component sensor histidine kinase